MQTGLLEPVPCFFSLCPFLPHVQTDVARVDMEGGWSSSVQSRDNQPQASESCLNEHFSLALKIISTFTLYLSFSPPTYSFI